MPVSEMTEGPASTAPWLAARGLVAGYLPGIDILRGVSVDAIRGQDKTLAAAALRATMELPGAEITDALASELPKAAAERRGQRQTR